MGRVSLGLAPEIWGYATRATLALAARFNPEMTHTRTHFWILKKDLEQAFAGAGS